MGHRKKHAPRHGSLGVRPRVRASDILPRVRSWPSKSWFDILVDTYGDEAIKIGANSKPVLLGYIAYKAGMSHAIVIDDKPNSPSYGKEVYKPVTILDAPPILVLGIRFYGFNVLKGLYTIGEVWRSPVESIIELYEKTYSENPFKAFDNVKDVIRKYLKGLRKVNHGLVKPDPSGEYGYRFVELDWEKKLSDLKSSNFVDIRVIVSTIPVLTGFGKKKPDIAEIRIGGAVGMEDKVKYAESILGNYVTADQVFREGQFVDVIGVSKGKGFQGVIKRFGVKELPRWHKHRKGSRKIGARSPGFGTMSEPPQAGQTGFHRRTEFNKRILRIGLYGWEITPKGGFINYGVVRGPYMVVEGSVIGCEKRALVLRHPIRPPRWVPLEPPRIVYYSLESKQAA
ncbi:MAG: 50S ribosomal protein L3 [Desulfurococcaceae archaeon]